MPQGQPDQRAPLNAPAAPAPVRFAAPGENAREPPHVPDHELLRRIGSGSYGEVWLARNVIGTLRAVKIVHRAGFDHDRPYEREYLGIQKFEPISRSHEGFVDILQVGRNDAEGYFYYVMELADSVASNQYSVISHQSLGVDRASGSALPLNTDSLITDSLITDYSPRTLRSEIQRRSRLPFDECIALGLSLARALAHLHAQFLVHRDVKPSNIIFVGGVPKLADIGLVTDVGEARSYVGTEGFIPPEGPGTPAADLYSLGKVLYEACTGKDRQDFPEPLTNLGDQPDKDRLLELNAILHCACHSDPRERYQSAEEMVAELELLERGESVKQKRAAERRWAVARNVSVAAAALALLATGVWFLVTRLSNPTVPRIGGIPELNSIAVLPIVNKGDSTSDDYLCDALTEETISALTHCGGLRVAPWRSVTAFKGWTNDFAEPGRQLRVRTVLTAGFLRNSNRMELKASIVNAPDGSNCWNAGVERNVEDLGGLGTELARQVARTLQVELPAFAASGLDTNLQRKLQAYRLLSAGERVLDAASAKSNFTEAVNLFQEALSVDLNCVPAHLGLGETYFRFTGWHLAPREAMPTARSHLLRVLELDPGSARARSMLGRIRLYFDYDAAGAEQDVRTAVKLGPTPEVLSGLLDYLWARGEWAEAEAVAKECRRRLPDAYWTASNLAGTYYFQRRYDRVLELTRWLIEREPNNGWGHWWECRAHVGREEFPEALLALARLKALDWSPAEMALEGYILGRMGRVEDALRTIEELERWSTQRFVSKGCSAAVYAGVNDRPKALDCLEKAYDERVDGIMRLKVDPMWDPLRDEPGFISLLKRAGLEK